MSDLLSPSVSVRVDTITLNPGQTITVYVANAHGMKTQVELRSVGVVGTNVGHPQIFFDEGVETVDSFDAWRPMDEACRCIYGMARLREPKPPQPKEKG
jgi:hypothetical protein